MDILAVERTILANERTILAYLRTMLALMAAGATVLQFFPEMWGSRAIGVALLVSGPILFVAGLRRYWRVRRSLQRTRQQLESTND